MSREDVRASGHRDDVADSAVIRRTDGEVRPEDCRDQRTPAFSSRLEGDLTQQAAPTTGDEV
jgi:hypothetical protein